MPTIVTEIPYRPVPVDPPRKRWTREECAALQSTGLWDLKPLELVEGELINRRMGKNRPHAVTMTAVRGWLATLFGEQYVETEAPIDVAPEDNPINQPEPDIIVLVKPSREFPEHPPQPADLRLVIEISDSTLGFDLKTKAALYARAGIVEYWVFDIPARRLIVHRAPQNGRYQSITVYRTDESVAPLAAPHSEFPAGDAFPG
jgi:Uma2 family endonuclease